MHSNFETFLRPFQLQGFEEDSYMRETDLVNVLDRCLANNNRSNNFNQDIFKELWESTLKNDEGDCVLLKDYIQTLCEAQDILKDKISKAQDMSFLSEIKENKKRELMVAIYSLSQDQKALFLRLALINCTSNQNQQGMPQSQVNPNDRTSLSIFAGDVNLYHKLSLGLSLVIWMAVISFLVDPVRMIGCFNFYSLFVDTLVLSIFLLNYFDRVYIRVVFLNILLAVVIQAVWLAIKVDDYWQQAQKFFNTILPGFARFVVVGTFITRSCKFLVALLLFRFRGYPHGIRKKANFIILQFKLDANPLRNTITATAKRVLPRFQFFDCLQNNRKAYILIYCNHRKKQYMRNTNNAPTTPPITNFRMHAFRFNFSSNTRESVSNCMESELSRSDFFYAVQRSLILFIILLTFPFIRFQRSITLAFNASTFAFALMIFICSASFIRSFS